ncbi:MAG TPA: ArsA-related P-loop ATPase [Mycobacteriales bacterium]|nr:ArsA-related P-loop ATPase [Mycobacteriales bacterium]
MTNFGGVRLHVVSGKGGTGKTTVAAALAVALAGEGRKVLLVEVEARQGLAPLFGHPPLPHAETRLARAERGGEVYGLSVDPEQALIEYLEMFYKMGRAGRVLRRMGAIDFVTTVAPGLRDVLLVGKVKEAVTRRSGAGHAYDAVVLDAPPTGRIVRFLRANEEVGHMAKVGPIARQSESVMALLRSSQTAVHLVTLLEEMPVQETVDGVEEIRKAGLPMGAVVVNKVRESQLGTSDLDAALHGRLDRRRLGSALKKVGLTTDTEAIDVLVVEAREHAERVLLQQAERAELEQLGVPLVDLPLVPHSIDLGTLRLLAAELVAAEPAT